MHKISCGCAPGCRERGQRISEALIEYKEFQTRLSGRVIESSPLMKRVKLQDKRR